MPLRFDETSLHAPVFQNVVSDYFPGLVEVLHVVHLEISNLFRVLSSLGLQQVSPCPRVELAKHF